MANKKIETKKCPSCLKDVPIQARRCSHCTQDLRSWPRRHPFLMTFLILITSPIWVGLLIGFIAVGFGLKDASNTTMPERRSEFNAKVNFDGTQFHITNLENVDCENSFLEVNSGPFKKPYSLDGGNLKAGQTYSVGAAQFVQGDGLRLNPFEVKPQTFSVGCRGDNELRSLIWGGSFN